MRRVIRNFVWKTSIIGLTASAVLAGTAWAQQSPSASAETQSKPNPVVRTFGLKGGYRTEVRSETKGVLCEDDRRQVSLLAAQVFQHVDKAKRALDAEDAGKARKEVDKGRTALKAIRALLPKTAVHTKTTAPDGTVIYDDEREVQDDRVALFEGMLHARTLAPIQAAQRDASEVAGVRVIEAETISTEVMADLGYVDAQLQRAARAIDEKKTDDAKNALMLAQVRGVDFQYRKEDSPLAEARDAIWLAKRALEENNTLQAQANLRVARQQLEIYRHVLPEAKRPDVNQMLNEVGQLEKQLHQEGNQTPNVSDRSRQGGTMTQWWDRLNGWIKRRL
jgi:hypothetical protein